MNYSNIFGAYRILLLIVLACVPVMRSETVSAGQYQEQLRDISTKVEALEGHPENAGAVVAAIPDEVTVTTGSGEVTVHHKALKDSLAAFAAADEKKRPALLQQLREYVNRLNVAADDSVKPGADPAQAHRQLDEILARREFKKIQEPTTKDVLLARLYRWLAHLLGKLKFGGKAAFDFMRVMIYLLVGIAATLLLVWIIRRLRRPGEELPAREIIPFSPSARSWRKWLAEARTLAQKEDWRNAIHMAYWAGISYLEEHGAWKPNRARTPREYLRLIGKPAAQYPVLAALTSKLEVVWYGYGSAAEADFQEALGHLEKLGCR